MGSAVAVQFADGGQWMHGVIKEANNTDLNGNSYIIKVTKTGRLIMCNMRHMCRTLITIEQDLWKQIKKGTRCLE